MNSLNSIGSLPSIRSLQPGGLAGLFDKEGLETSGSSSFADVLKRMVSDVSHLNDTAQNAIAAFVRGEDVELHQVMAAVEEANLSLEMLVEIKNQFVDAYRTVTSMQ